MGSVLLLYRRTKLIGIFTLLPVMVNICLLNFFYGFDTGEKVHALVLFGGLLYLLFEEYPRLLAFFLAKPAPPVLQFRGRILRNTVRLSVLFLPVLLISGFHFPRQNPVLGGRYRVTRLWMNEAELYPGNCSDSMFSRVYFEGDDHCTFLYRNDERMRLGSFTYDRKSGLVRVSWHYPAGAGDTLVAQVLSVPGGLGLEGRMGKVPVRMELSRMP